MQGRPLVMPFVLSVRRSGPRRRDHRLAHKRGRYSCSEQERSRKSKTSGATRVFSRLAWAAALLACDHRRQEVVPGLQRLHDHAQDMERNKGLQDAEGDFMRLRKLQPPGGGKRTRTVVAAAEQSGRDDCRNNKKQENDRDGPHRIMTEVALWRLLKENSHVIKDSGRSYGKVHKPCVLAADKSPNQAKHEQACDRFARVAVVDGDLALAFASQARRDDQRDEGPVKAARGRIPDKDCAFRLS